MGKKYVHKVKRERLSIRRLCEPLVKVTRFRIYRDVIADYSSNMTRVLVARIEPSDLGPENIDEILALPDRSLTRDVLERRFERGDYCLGFRRDGQLIGFMWAVFNWLNFGAYNMPLQDDEAYIIDGYVVPEFRGKGLGGHSYVQVLERLKPRGYKFTYSVTIIDNSLAIGLRGRLKSKLVDEGVSITLFNRWRFGSKARPEKLRAP